MMVQQSFPIASGHVKEKENYIIMNYHHASYPLDPTRYLMMIVMGVMVIFFFFIVVISEIQHGS